MSTVCTTAHQIVSIRIQESTISSHPCIEIKATDDKGDEVEHTLFCFDNFPQIRYDNDAAAARFAPVTPGWSPEESTMFECEYQGSPAGPCCSAPATRKRDETDVELDRPDWLCDRHFQEAVKS